MKIYSCVITIAVEDDGNHYDYPAKWNWGELIGEGVEAVSVYDVTDGDIDRVRLTANGPEDI